MKKTGWLGLLMCLVLALAAGTAAAEAAGQEIVPMEIAQDGQEPENGTFRLTIEDTDQITKGGYFTAVLYLEDRYDPEQIENMKAGDRVQVNEGDDRGEKRLLVSYEVLPEEEIPSYLAFENTREGDYIAVFDDWSPVSFVTRMKIMLPLPDEFAWYDGAEEELLSAEELLELLSIPLDDGSTDCFSPYSTTAVFRDGLMTEIRSFPYPYGPDE